MDVDDFDKDLKSRNRIFVLFYASWCPFSQRFLPIFEEYSKTSPEVCMRVVIDDKPSLCERFSIEYYPTVLLFEKGKIARRLDAEPGVELNKKQLREFTNKK